METSKFVHMTLRLGDFADIQLGIYDQPVDTGNTAYLQVRHFDDEGQLQQPPDTFIMTEVVPNAHDLRQGDVLLTGKGYRNFAWAYDPSIGRAVASPAFFVIRPRKELVLAGYLAIALNAPSAKKWLSMLGAGNSIPSIRKSELESMELDVPLLKTQKKIIELNRLYQSDMALSRQLMAEKQKVFYTAIRELISRRDNVIIPNWKPPSQWFDPK